MKVKLVFSNSVYVSAGDWPCEIVIKFGDGLLFKETNQGLPLE